MSVGLRILVFAYGSFYFVGDQLSPTIWTDAQLDTLICAVDRSGDGCISYEYFAAWVMEGAPAPQIIDHDLASEQELLRSIQLGCSQGPATLSSLNLDSLKPEEFPSEEALLFATLSTDPPTDPPTRRPSVCSAPDEADQLADQLKGTLVLEEGEVDLMASIRLAAAQGSEATVSELTSVDAQPSLASKKAMLSQVLSGALLDEPLTEPPTRKNSFEES
eukprot:CAMPEP_0169201724 /NCGR_PEP_ID=MMETSP1016-20121227/10553_1 /TAXON_ID=342587 /ORGANISM="Karlodinium micrum, Strain CCMP2283" /LENGTH=218 /DNA_ID=CAMNT_0009278655 /DNA_START=554 /DNA_END=1210 /DNA_ORIENTATION=-